jgi:hypothetical protein
VLTGRMGTLEERASVLANSSLHDKRENQPAPNVSRTMERRASPPAECAGATSVEAFDERPSPASRRIKSVRRP